MNFRTLTATPDADEVRTADLFGRTHLVAPVVMVTEGVLKDGYVPASEIAYSANGWNGRPITAPPQPGTAAHDQLPDDLPDGMSGHPLTPDGEFTSANEDPYLDDMAIGTVRNVEATDDGSKLVGEAWLDVARVDTVGEYAMEVATALADGDPLDVSIGFWHDIEDDGGSFDDTEFSYTVRNIMPDHLAMLPNETGACSWEDGCGLPRAATADLVSDGETDPSRWRAAMTAAADDETVDADADMTDDEQSLMSRLKTLARLVTVTPDDDGGTDPEPMQNDINLDALSEETGVSVDTLEAMSDDELSSLCDCVSAATDDGGDADPPTDGQADAADGDADDATVDHLVERITELENRIEEQRASELSDEIDTIAAHTDHDADDIAEWNDKAIEALAEQVSERRSATGGGARAVNRLGQAGGADADADDTPDGVESVGALTAMTRSEGGD
jgi:hypothetical protein